MAPAYCTFTQTFEIIVPAAERFTVSVSCDSPTVPCSWIACTLDVCVHVVPFTVHVPLSASGPDGN